MWHKSIVWQPLYLSGGVRTQIENKQHWRGGSEQQKYAGARGYQFVFAKYKWGICLKLFWVTLSFDSKIA